MAQALNSGEMDRTQLTALRTRKGQKSRGMRCSHGIEIDSKRVQNFSYERHVPPVSQLTLTGNHSSRQSEEPADTTSYFSTAASNYTHHPDDFVSIAYSAVICFHAEVQDNLQFRFLFTSSSYRRV